MISLAKLRRGRCAWALVFSSRCWSRSLALMRAHFLTQQQHGYMATWRLWSWLLPKITRFQGMNIHIPAILMDARSHGFDSSPYVKGKFTSKNRRHQKAMFLWIWFLKASWGHLICSSWLGLQERWCIQVWSLSLVCAFNFIYIYIYLSLNIFYIYIYRYRYRCRYIYIYIYRYRFRYIYM